MIITEQLYEALREMFPLFYPGPDRPDCDCVHCKAGRKARAALAAYEASKAPPTPSPLLWCCHVRGPDDVHPAPDYQTALKWSDMINEWSDQANAKFKDEDKVMSKAAPALWPGSPESHAQNLAKAIAGFSPRTPACRAVPAEPLTKGNI